MNILEELYNIIINSIESGKKRPGRDKVMEYLLGTEAGSSLSSSSFGKIYAGFLPKYDTLDKIASSKNRSSQRLKQCLSLELKSINTSGLLTAANNLLKETLFSLKLPSENNIRKDSCF